MTGYTKSMDYTSFKRYCKVLTLRDDRELIEKYKEVHKRGNTWPEIPRGIRDVGILDMEIYIHGTVLFMIMDTVPDFDHEKAMKKLAGLPRQAEWEEYVSKFQQAGEKGRRRRNGRWAKGYSSCKNHRGDTFNPSIPHAFTPSSCHNFSWPNLFTDRMLKKLKSPVTCTLGLFLTYICLCNTGLLV